MHSPLIPLLIFIGACVFIRRLIRVAQWARRRLRIQRATQGPFVGDYDSDPRVEALLRKGGGL